VLLPGTSFFLGMKRFAPARKMIDAGCAVALATDLQPRLLVHREPAGSRDDRLRRPRSAPIEALAMFTRNAAYAVGLGHEVGRIAPGYRADLLVLDVPNHRHVAYHHGVNHVTTVVHHGDVVAG